MPTFEKRPKQHEQRDVKDAIGNYISSHSIYEMKRNELQSSIALAAQVATPNLNTISHILKHDFGIQFRRLDGAQSKYLYPYFY